MKRGVKIETGTRRAQKVDWMYVNGSKAYDRLRAPLLVSHLPPPEVPRYLSFSPLSSSGSLPQSPSYRRPSFPLEESHLYCIYVNSHWNSCLFYRVLEVACIGAFETSAQRAFACGNSLSSLVSFRWAVRLEIDVDGKPGIGAAAAVPICRSLAGVSSLTMHVYLARGLVIVWLRAHFSLSPLYIFREHTHIHTSSHVYK